MDNTLFTSLVCKKLFDLQISYMLGLREIVKQHNLNEIDICEYLRSQYCDRYQNIIYYNLAKNFDFDFSDARPENNNTSSEEN